MIHPFPTVSPPSPAVAVPTPATVEIPVPTGAVSTPYITRSGRASKPPVRFGVNSIIYVYRIPIFYYLLYNVRISFLAVFYIIASHALYIDVPISVIPATFQI